ncbi:Fic family protein [Clostridium sp.]|jgi:Fic family protein|uniref:Fic family protein n=1 Tax=Clostridium sp. TaxID=1506 RepID=UPI00258D9581|nr:Fic family protein [Clostridium sp.]MDF2505545.1 cell division protein Fic [Clostridium sp.]
MNSFLNNKLNSIHVPMRIIRLLSKINEYKGKQDLYRQQSPQILESLKNVAIIESTKASNEIEGITIHYKRLEDIINRGEPINLENRSEGEIMGYKEVLDLIHTSAEHIPLNPNVILQLHTGLYKFVATEGGKWKNSDNFIQETLPNGSKFIRFQPVNAFKTPDAMEQLLTLTNESIKTDDIDPLILIGAFILDFLCIHPFNDGNGRMARLLTLLLLYKFGYEVGRFISLEKIIEKNKEEYYNTLYQSSQKWHEGEHDLIPWLEYILGVIVSAYKEFEVRVGNIGDSKGSKGDRVENSINHIIGAFTKEDIRKVCPDVGESTINRVLAKLKEEKKIEVTGKGRSAKWIKI